MIVSYIRKKDSFDLFEFDNKKVQKENTNEKINQPTAQSKL